MKKIRGIRYAYLVESVWDRERKQPKQRTIKYLGRIDDISMNDIPEEYRSDPNILRFLEMVDELKIGKGHVGGEDGEYERHNERTQDHKSRMVLSNDSKGIIEILSSGDVDRLLNIYKVFVEKYKGKDLALLEFYNNIIIPALNEVGYLWMRDELGIAIEHVCSNTTLGLIQVIENYNAQNMNNDTKKGNVLICTPYGDLHSIPCKMVESILMSKGYKVYNIAPSTPRETVIKYVQEVRPRIIILSVTLSSRVKAAERLVKELLKRYGYSITIIVGGRGISEMSLDKEVIIVKSLQQLAELL